MKSLAYVLILFGTIMVTGRIIDPNLLAHFMTAYINNKGNNCRCTECLKALAESLATFINMKITKPEDIEAFIANAPSGCAASKVSQGESLKFDDGKILTLTNDQLSETDEMSSDTTLNKETAITEITTESALASLAPVTTQAAKEPLGSLEMVTTQNHDISEDTMSSFGEKAFTSEHSAFEKDNYQTSEMELQHSSATTIMLETTSTVEITSGKSDRDVTINEIAVSYSTNAYTEMATSNPDQHENGTLLREATTENHDVNETIAGISRINDVSKSEISINESSYRADIEAYDINYLTAQENTQIENDYFSGLWP